MKIIGFTLKGFIDGKYHYQYTKQTDKEAAIEWVKRVWAMNSVEAHPIYE